MYTSEQVFKLQTQLSTWSGTKKIAGWLAATGLLLCVIGLVLVLAGKEERIGSAFAPLSIVIISGLLRREAGEKIRSIEAKLTS